jgi:hypothetical protein
MLYDPSNRYKSNVMVGIKKIELDEKLHEFGL